MVVKCISRPVEPDQAKSNSNGTFVSVLKRFKFKSFVDTNIKVVVKKAGKQKEIAYQRDILGKLVSQSYASKKGVDMERVLSYPLAPVSIPLSTPDGSIRKTVKSKLFDAAMSDLRVIDATQLPNASTLDTYFLDLVAVKRTISGSTGTIRELAWNILNTVPRQFSTVYLVCDTLDAGSIKSGERIARGTGKRYVLNSPDMKVPFDFSNFLRNGENKAMLLNLIELASYYRKQGKVKKQDHLLFQQGTLPINQFI